MYDALLQNSLRSIDAVRRHLLSSDGFRALVAQTQLKCAGDKKPCFDLSAIQSNVPTATDWKIIDHCAAVTRLYAIYEQFVHELLAEFLAFLESNVPYSGLDQGLRKEHRRTLGIVLSNMDRDKYKSLSFDAVIADVAGAFSDGGRYRLLPEAMLSHDQNLRLGELQILFSRCGIVGVSDWLQKHRVVKEYFSKVARQSDKVEAELGDFINYRNDAAHGGVNVDSVLGVNSLVEYADFLTALLVALTECVSAAVIDKAVQFEKLHQAGVVKENFSKNIVVAIVENCTLKVDDTVYLKGEGFCYSAKLLSLQKDDVDIESFTALKPAELGLRLE